MGRARAVLALLLMLALVVPLHSAPAAALSSSGRMIIGFLPYWMAGSWDPSSAHYTDVVFFSAPVRGDGSLDLSRVEQHQQDIQRIRDQCGCRVHLAVTLFDKDTADKVLAYHRIELANNIRSAVLSYGFDGVNIDFEFMRDKNKYTGQDNTDLMIDVLERLKNSGIKVGIDVAGSVETVWRDARLQSYVDYVFLMGYDYHYAGSKNTGSVSPLESSGISLEWSINKLLQYYPASKIVLGLPLYGYEWPAQSCQPGARTEGSGHAETLKYIENSILPGATQHWDPTARSPWLSFTSGGTCRQVWYENATSIAIKADYALQRGLAGFGFWALGYAQGSPSGEKIDMLVESRRSPPSIGAVRISVEGSEITVKLENANFVSSIRLEIPVGSGVQVESYSGGSFQLARLSAAVQGGVLIVEANASEPFPGYGIHGSGVLATITLSGAPSTGNPSAEAWAHRLDANGGTMSVEASIGEVSLEHPGGGGGGGSGPGGHHGGSWGITYTPPVSPTNRAPFLGAGMTGLAAIIAAIAVAVFLMILKFVF